MPWHLEVNTYKHLNLYLEEDPARRGYVPTAGLPPEKKWKDVIQYTRQIPHGGLQPPWFSGEQGQSFSRRKPGTIPSTWRSLLLLFFPNPFPFDFRICYLL